MQNSTLVRAQAPHAKFWGDKARKEGLPKFAQIAVQAIYREIGDAINTIPRFLWWELRGFSPATRRRLDYLLRKSDPKGESDQPSKDTLATRLRKALFDNDESFAQDGEDNRRILGIFCINTSLLFPKDYQDLTAVSKCLDLAKRLAKPTSELFTDDATIISILYLAQNAQNTKDNTKDKSLLTETKEVLMDLLYETERHKIRALATIIAGFMLPTWLLLSIPDSEAVLRGATYFLSRSLYFSFISVPLQDGFKNLSKIVENKNDKKRGLKQLLTEIIKNPNKSAEVLNLSLDSATKAQNAEAVWSWGTDLGIVAALVIKGEIMLALAVAIGGRILKIFQTMMEETQGAYNSQNTTTWAIQIARTSAEALPIAFGTGAAVTLKESLSYVIFTNVITAIQSRITLLNRLMAAGDNKKEQLRQLIGDEIKQSDSNNALK